MPMAALLPSFSAGVDSKAIEKRLEDLRKIQTGAISQIKSVRNIDPKGLTVSEQLQVKLVALKRLTASIAMYLDPEWRSKLFARLDAMLDPDGWDPEATLPSEQSFSTFLRMIIFLHPTRRPGIGITPKGHFAAAWVRSQDRIVIECLGNDEVRWVIAREVDGERETGAGKVQLHRIPDVTAGYDPQPLFNDADGQRLLA
jgi:hypothetical protein